MKRWPTQRLCELAEVTAGFAWKSSHFSENLEAGPPVIRIQNLGSNDNAVFIYYTGEVEPGYWVDEGDLLVSLSGSFKVCRWQGPKALLNQRIVVIRPGQQLNRNFVFFQISERLQEISRAAVGIAVANASMGTVRDMEMTVPPLAEQERIVKLLDEADELHKLRAQSDRRTAALIPALFHEMFGDLIANSKGWPQSSFAEVGKLDRGRSRNRPRDDASLYGGKYPFIQTGDVANSNGEITTYTQTYSEKGLDQSRMWPAGTLCITIAANIGKTAILTFSACFPDSMVGFVPGEKVVVDYVRQWLVTMESRLEEAAPQMAQKNINLKILSELTIPVPPLALQKDFAARVSEIRAVQADQSAGRKRLDDLFQSTLHRAFEGEL